MPSDLFPTGRFVHKTLQGKIIKTEWNGKTCAAKLFYIPRTADVKDDLQNEIAIMRDLRNIPHPHVLHSLEDGVAKDKAWIYMPLIEGGELLDRLMDHRNGLSQPACLNFARQLLMALIHVHSLGWIHGDVSLENILVTEKCCLKLCDFGLAKRIGTPRPNGGKRNYKPPEMFNVSKKFIVADVSQDVFMLGVCLWSMLFGIMPFENTGRGCRAYWQVFVLRNIEFIRHWNLDENKLNSHVCTVTRRMLVDKPVNRPFPIECLDFLIIYA